MCARISCDQAVEVLVLLNGCFRPAAVRSSSAATAVLAQDDGQVHAGLSGALVGYGQETSLPRLEARLRDLPLAPDEAAACLSGHLFRLSPAQPVYVTLAETPVVADRDATDRQLAAGLARARASQMQSAGAAEHCAEAIQRLVEYCAAYDPASGRRFVPVNRDWSGPNDLPPVFMWDNTFDSYLACFHHPELAKDSFRHLLGLIETRGMAGAPTQRNLIVPVVYAKAVRFPGDREFAAATLPTIMTFIRFFFGDRGDGHPWRDGNDDGLIELGSCLRPGQMPLARIIQNTFDETGYDDSPMYSAGFAYEWRGLLADGVDFDFRRGTLNLTMVGQNALYVAAGRAVAIVARWVGATADEAWLSAEAERVAGRVRVRLFDPEVGDYRNRFFDGRFSPVKTPDLFYPLLASLCDEPTAGKLRAMLLDPKQFWGENVIPSVSRDDPAYGDDPIHGEYWRGNCWRGNVWPPMNYITYLAVRQAGWPEVAAELARQSRQLFLADWLTRRHAHENYPPAGTNERTHLFAGYGGRDPHYIWSCLLPLMSLEELFGVEDTCEGLRFGSLQPSSWGSWSGFHYHGQRGRIRCDAAGLELDLPGLLQVRADRPIAIRQFVLCDGEGRFRYDAAAPVNLTVVCAGRSRQLALAAANNRAVP